ncbi:MAG: Ig-like domain-containing protein [Bacteroidales bacterium]|nr:Ig-like domain-containing protein [Bacteroidales bacterium]
MKRIVPFAFFLIFVISILFPRCAVIVSPEGGPKDTLAPVMLKSVPKLNATGFKKDRIVFTFDEYIKLDKINQKLVLSPPQEQTPSTKIKGKSLEVKFFEPLADSTTYTLYFADAIQDNNEGNPIDNFEFAFSTGSHIDSLKYIGQVIDAFTLEPQEGVFVMLYEDFADSVPIIQRPRYVTKTNKAGVFFLSNLKLRDYKIFALRDGNSNYLFDQITEELAFSKNVVEQSRLGNPSDKPSRADSLQILWLFKERSRVQSLTDYSRAQRRRIRLGFTQKPVGKVSLKPIGYDLDSTEQWFIRGANIVGDSLDFWLTHPSISADNSLRAEITYLKTDSLMNLVPQVDTLRLHYSEIAQKATFKRGKKDTDEEEAEKAPVQSVSTSVRAGDNVLPNQQFNLLFSMPQLSIDTSLVTLTNVTDSITIPLPAITIDSLDPRVYSLSYNWQNIVNYRFDALPGAFINLDSLTNDTLSINFRGANPEMFGVINLNIVGVSHNVIVQLVGGKDKVVDQKIAEADGKVIFNYVKPAKYNLRFIIDENQNGKWDTGRYIEGIQPEKIYFYEDELQNRDIQVRSNWEYDLNYKLK